MKELDNSYDVMEQSEVGISNKVKIADTEVVDKVVGIDRVQY